MGKTAILECYKECGRYSQHCGFNIPHREHYASITKADRLMLYTEIHVYYILTWNT